MNLSGWAVCVVAVLHVAFLVLEMFLWTTSIGGTKILRMSQAEAEASWPVAANQGLSNGFLAAGLLLTLFGGIPAETACTVQVLFLSFIALAGVFGAATVNPPARDRIKVNPVFLLLQTLPAVVALALLNRG